jgi:hypothetical protein
MDIPCWYPADWHTGKTVIELIYDLVKTPINFRRQFYSDKSSNNTQFGCLIDIQEWEGIPVLIFFNNLLAKLPALF